MKNTLTPETEAKIEAFGKLVRDQQYARYIKDYAEPTKGAEYAQHTIDNAERACKVTIKPGVKYTKVDVGDSGKFMVVNSTGEIFGIKAYGVIHRGHQYGTLDTTNEWAWGGYSPKALKTEWDGRKHQVVSPSTSPAKAPGTFKEVIESSDIDFVRAALRVRGYEDNGKGWVNDEKVAAIYHNSGNSTWFTVL